MKLTIRHFLFPFVLWFYHREPINQRGQYLRAYQFVSDTDNAVELYLARFEGFKYGVFRFQSTAPHVTIKRKDGVFIEHDLRADAESEISIENSGMLILKRRSSEPFLICRVSVVHALQLIGVYHRLPNELKKCFKTPEVNNIDQSRAT
jgi:hypothetical protein